MFDRKRPCANCPFRKGKGAAFLLGKERLEGIRHQEAFQCHKTVDYSENWEGEPGDTPQQCAGLIAILHRENTPNTIMQVAQRLIGMDFSEFDPNHDAYECWEDALKDHCHEG